MAKSSLEELKGQVAAGQYAIDPADLAGDMLSKFDLVRRVRRLIGEDEDEDRAADEGGRAAPARRSRGARPASSLPPKPQQQAASLAPAAQILR